MSNVLQTMVVAHGVLTFIFFINTAVCTSAIEVLLNSAQGKLRGVRSEDGIYESFHGIPYAGKINKNNRFKRAPPPQSWEGIREAISPGASCLTAPSGNIQGDEDCLFLNVNVPTRTRSDPPFPVMVWIHGGGFTTGSGTPSLYGPARLMRHKIILVTVNYRLGPLGFLCFDHETVPGNAGVKDVIMALRWVRDNIVAFGGDASRVTVAGQGTGAAIADALTLSKMADGLYHRVIAQSGTVLSPWAFNYDSESRARLLGRYFTNATDANDLVKKLLSAKASDLIFNARKINAPYFPFALCAENAFKREERFLNGYPIEILNEKKFYHVPYMTGFNSNEGFIFASLYKQFKKRQKHLLLPEEFFKLSRTEKNDIRSKIKHSYFEDEFSFPNFLTYARDAFFLNHIYRNVQLRTKHSTQPVYFYEINFQNDEHLIETRNLSSGHGDELKFLFGNSDIEGAADQMVDQITSLWTNFIKNGNPTADSSGRIIEWKATARDSIKLLKIDETLEMQTFTSHHKMLIWDELYNHFYYKRSKILH